MSFLLLFILYISLTQLLIITSGYAGHACIYYSIRKSSSASKLSSPDRISAGARLVEISEEGGWTSITRIIWFPRTILLNESPENSHQYRYAGQQVHNMQDIYCLQ
jgi:hypothetical protein